MTDPDEKGPTGDRDDEGEKREQRRAQPNLCLMQPASKVDEKGWGRDIDWVSADDAEDSQTRIGIKPKNRGLNKLQRVSFC